MNQAAAETEDRDLPEAPRKRRGAVAFAGRWLLRLVSGISVMVIIGLAAIFVIFWAYGRHLPNFDKLANYEPPIVSRVYAGNGELIGEFASEKRIFVPISRIPKRVSHAFISAEDQRFYYHNGVDLLGMIRAAWTTLSNIGGSGRLVGGSTITQQVAKNFLLTSNKTLERKVKEIILSLRIEQVLTKDQILELYLNEINLGNRAYGVGAAAQVYFNKSLDELSVAEAALLGGLPQAPSRYNPLRHPKEARRRRDYVIQRMLADGYITKAQAQTALATPVRVVQHRKNVSSGAEYFVEEVRRILLAKYGETKMKLGGFQVRSTLDPELQHYADVALHDGLVAYDRRHGYRGPVTNLGDRYGDRWASGWKAKLAKVEPPAGYGKWQLAVVLDLDKKAARIGFKDGRRGTIPLRELTWARKQGIRKRASGAIMKAAVGPRIRKPADVLKRGDVVLVEKVTKTAKGKDYPDGTYTLRQIPIATGAIVAMDPHTGRVLAMTGGFSFWISQFNNVTQAMRQPGSAFKPVVYLTALENGFTPSTLILDAPVVVKMANGRKYKPRNYSGKFYGPTTMRRGLELSRNVMTIRLAERVGLAKVADMATRLGVLDHPEPVMAMALGAYETTPLKMATAYSMIVNGGKRITPTLIDRIQDRHGHTIYRHDERKCPACRAVKWEHQEMPVLPDKREQVVSPQSAFQMVSLMEGVVQRGTGTKVLAVKRPLAGKTGTTNDVRDAWFVGFSPDLVVAVWIGFDKPLSLGYHEAGGITAAPVFRDFMKKAIGDKPPVPFRVPKGLVATRVNLDTGLPAKEGKRVITEYFKPGHEPTSRSAFSPDGIRPGGGDKKFEAIPGEEY
jgi:penicillin-binding protein 1A